ncbi:MAG: homoserine dehydrogenase [bacterium]|jgi:homoserine dehydrogenase
MKKIKIGLIGFGTVGAGVVKVLNEKRASLKASTGLDLEIVRICVKHISSKRPVEVAKDVLTSSIDEVLYDKQIDIVVELIGGIQPAKEIIMEALRQGKHVVTANKALLAECGAEIFGLSQKLRLAVGFEASVGGGIPIIRSLREGFIANKIDLIYGILNGTSNFILSEMSEHGTQFKDALLYAQKLGYAEKDPSFDVGGIDSAHKLSILALLGFGVFAAQDSIYTEGITDIEQSDIDYASENGYAIKLLAIAKRRKEGVELRVHPTLIPKTHLLANVGDVYNAIFVRGDLVGDNLFYGKGAGSLPTASSVVSDLVSVAAGIAAGVIPCITPVAGTASAVCDMSDIRSRYYVRFTVVDKPGVLSKISGILGNHDISIATVTQKEIKSEKPVPIVMMSHEARESDMAAALRIIDELDVIKSKTVCVRVEE